MTLQDEFPVRDIQIAPPSDRDLMNQSIYDLQARVRRLESILLEQTKTPTPEQSASTLEARHMHNSDGSDIYRIALPGKQWIVLNSRNNVLTGAFHEDMDGTRYELNPDEYEPFLENLPIYSPVSRYGDADPAFDTRTMNDDRE